MVERKIQLFRSKFFSVVSKVERLWTLLGSKGGIKPLVWSYRKTLNFCLNFLSPFWLRNEKFGSQWLFPREKYHYLGCKSVLKGDSESETILTLLVCNSHIVWVWYLGGESRRRLHVTNNMIWKTIIFRELVMLILSWLVKLDFVSS